MRENGCSWNFSFILLPGPANDENWISLFIVYCIVHLWKMMLFWSVQPFCEWQIHWISERVNVSTFQYYSMMAFQHMDLLWFAHWLWHQWSCAFYSGMSYPWSLSLWAKFWVVPYIQNCHVVWKLWYLIMFYCFLHSLTMSLSDLKSRKRIGLGG